MQYVNLCPHAITIIGDNGGVVRIIPPSGVVARCTEKSEYLPEIEPSDIPLLLRTYGDVTGLPDEGSCEPGYYIVSNMVRQALPKRLDLASPGDTVRNPDGNIIGVKNLIVNEV